MYTPFVFCKVSKNIIRFCKQTLFIFIQTLKHYVAKLRLDMKQNTTNCLFLLGPGTKVSIGILWYLQYFCASQISLLPWIT